ncbi:MAG: HRDC domain-containing protein [Zavarzinella sp.]
MDPLPQRMVETDVALQECCDDILQARLVGFDIEFISENTFTPDLCLIQLATHNALYIVDPLSKKIGGLKQLYELLVGPERTVIVHSGREEVRMLMEHHGDFPTNLFDTQVAAGFVGHRFPSGYKTLVGDIVKRKISKNETLTHWDRRPLTENQLAYAFNDVRFLIPLYEKLSHQLEELGRTEWAVEEVANRTKYHTEDRIESERWRRLRGVGDLSQRSLAILRDLFNWRENQANTENIVVRRIMGDDQLVDIARKSPTRFNQISEIRGVNRRYTSEIFAVVTKARELPNDELPAPLEKRNDNDAVITISQVAYNFLDDWCSNHRLSINLTATVPDIRLAVRAMAGKKELPPTNIFSSGWRNNIVWPVLEAFITGKKAIRVARYSGKHPFDFYDCEDLTNQQKSLLESQQANVDQDENAEQSSLEEPSED